MAPAYAGSMSSPETMTVAPMKAWLRQQCSCPSLSGCSDAPVQQTLYIIANFMVAYPSHIYSMVCLNYSSTCYCSGPHTTCAELQRKVMRNPRVVGKSKPDPWDSLSLGPSSPGSEFVAAEFVRQSRNLAAAKTIRFLSKDPWSRFLRYQT